MAVVHLVRETSLPRNVLVVLNSACSKYPNRRTIHSMLYKLAVRSVSQNKPFKLASVHSAVKALIDAGKLH